MLLQKDDVALLKELFDTQKKQILDEVNEKFEKVYVRLDRMEERQDRMEGRQDTMDARLDKIDARLDKVDTRLDNLENDTHSMKLVIENEIRPGIMRVAEGHLDLERHLMEAARPNSETEILAVKVRFLEGEVKRLKAKIS